MLCSSGGESSSKTLGSSHRGAPLLSTSSSSENRLIRWVSVVVVSSFCSTGSMTEHFFSSKSQRRSTFLASVKAQGLRLRSASMADEQFILINRRLLSGLGQTFMTQVCWAWAIFWIFGLYFGPLRVLGCKLYLLCLEAFIVCPLILQQISLSSSTFHGCICHLRCHPLATSWLFSHRITGYCSSFLLPSLNTSSVGPICFQASITFVDLASAQIWRSLLTGYFSGVSLTAFKAFSGYSKPRTTLVGLIVVTSQCMVIFSSLVDDYVLIAFSLMALLVLVCFDISPGALSSSFKLVSLCLFFVCSYVLIFKLAIRSCPTKPNPFVSF